MSSQIKHTAIKIHPLDHILDTWALIFSSWPFLQFIPTASLPSPCDNHQSEGGPKEHSAKEKWLRETHSVTYVPGLSTLSDLSRIVAQPPPSFLCCLRPPSHNTLLAIRYSSILSTCSNHLNTLWSALLANSLSIPALLRTSSFLTIQSRHSNRT